MSFYKIIIYIPAGEWVESKNLRWETSNYMDPLFISCYKQHGVLQSQRSWHTSQTDPLELSLLHTHMKEELGGPYDSLTSFEQHIMWPVSYNMLHNLHFQPQVINAGNIIQLIFILYSVSFFFISSYIETNEPWTPRSA